MNLFQLILICRRICTKHHVCLLPYRSEPRNTFSNDPAEGEEEEILGSDDDEQEDPRDYCRGD
jgi:hypothetical protein